jgi:hypothetical protein
MHSLGGDAGQGVRRCGCSMAVLMLHVQGVPAVVAALHCGWRQATHAGALLGPRHADPDLSRGDRGHEAMQRRRAGILAGQGSAAVSTVIWARAGALVPASCPSASAPDLWRGQPWGLLDADLEGDTFSGVYPVSGDLKAVTSGAAS